MSWIAEEPVPYGLANLEGRLGFNSAWLMYVSALRLDDFLGWHHVVHAEVVIRTLFFSWLVWRFAVTWCGDWSEKSLLYALAMVFGFVMDPGRHTSTDVAANLCALLAWVTFCELWSDERDGKSVSRHRLAILTTLVAFACSIKLSV
jgi:hypothetical protein